MQIEFELFGEAKGLARHRSRIAGHGEKKWIQEYDPPENREQKAYARQACENAMQRAGLTRLIEEALELVAIVYVARPMSHFGTGRNAAQVKESAPMFPTSKPDLTNIEKLLEDACEKVLYRNDSQFASKISFKRYTLGTPKTLIRIRTLEARDLGAEERPVEPQQWLLPTGSEG